MTSTYTNTTIAVCGECGATPEHLPSCSEAPEYGPGDAAPPVLMFDRRIQTDRRTK